MHRATHPFANSRALSPYFREHLTLIAAFGKKVTMAPMSAGNPIRRLQARADSGSDGFLADGQMHPAWQSDFGNESRESLLRASNEEHALVQAEKVFLIERCGRFCYRVRRTGARFNAIHK
jgi:hypothetical protein